MCSNASMRLKGLIVLVGLCNAMQATAQAMPIFDELLNLSLDELNRIKVVTATRHELPRQLAPAVIRVITAADIRQWGYRSVAEALQQIPGFYDVYDGVGHNVGTRGINSGARVYSRGLKVMIDNQAIALRSDGSHLTGLALIPVEAIERIEVISGPASALYGADAYLGVINVITRRFDDATELTAYGQRQGNGSTGGGLNLLYANEHYPHDLLLAASVADLDRSGQPLPASSPRYAQLNANSPSLNDQLRPGNLFASASRQQLQGQTRLMAYRQQISADAEFLDLDPLSHDNTVALLQSGVRLQQDWQLSPMLLQGSVHYARGGVDNRHERLVVGSNRLERDYGFDLWELGLQGTSEWANQQLNWGMDYSDDDEKLLQVFGIDPYSGERRLLGTPTGRQHFINTGAFVQYRWQTGHRWSYTANIRYDDHNLYGSNTNYRLGLNTLLQSNMWWKLLYGTSYKAPSAFQLYAQPMASGDIIGNPQLKPETASAWESQWSWQPSSQHLLELTAYHLSIKDKIEVLPIDFNLNPQNISQQRGWGVEGEWRMSFGLQGLSLQGAWQNSEDINHHAFLGNLRSATASYPQLQGRIAWNLNRTRLGNWAVSTRYASPRRASATNIGTNLGRSYQLPSYSTWRLNWSQDWQQHRLQLTVDNLFDKSYAEAGYGGVDLPAGPRQITLAWQWQAQ